VTNETLRRQTYTVEEAAKLLGIGRTPAYNAARNGELGGVPVIRVGRRLLVPKPALDSVLAGNGAGGEARTLREVKL
jgi:excisionase family DNA binding protein